MTGKYIKSKRGGQGCAVCGVKAHTRRLKNGKTVRVVSYNRTYNISGTPEKFKVADKRYGGKKFMTDMIAALGDYGDWATIDEMDKIMKERGVNPWSYIHVFQKAVDDGLIQRRTKYGVTEYRPTNAGPTTREQLDAAYNKQKGSGIFTPLTH